MFWNSSLHPSVQTGAAGLKPPVTVGLVSDSGAGVTSAGSCAWRPPPAAVGQGAAEPGDSAPQPMTHACSHILIYFFGGFFFFLLLHHFFAVSSRISPVRRNKVVSMATEKQLTDSQRCQSRSELPPTRLFQRAKLF